MGVAEDSRYSSVVLASERNVKPYQRAEILSWMHRHSSAKNALTLENASPMDYRPRLYIATAFIAGVLLTLGFKDLYPDLERRYRQHRRLRKERCQQTRNSTLVGAGLDEGSATYNIDDDGGLIGLEDHTSSDEPENSGGTGKGRRRRQEPDVLIHDGVEACVGNTPLFRIKSLSEETGCEIWAKAEVNLSWLTPKLSSLHSSPTSHKTRRDCNCRRLMTVMRGTVYKRGRREPQGPSSFEYHQHGKLQNEQVVTLRFDESENLLA